MLSDEKIKKIADEGIAEGKTYSPYAWHYVGEDTAHEIICSAIRKALQQSDEVDNSRPHNPDSWTECEFCGLIHDPKLTRCHLS